MDRRDHDAKVYCPVCRKPVLSRLVVEHLRSAEHQARSPWTPPAEPISPTDT